ncbi:MAG: hypothetical protein AB7G93_23355 [Bdellovibrionales bacterium]
MKISVILTVALILGSVSALADRTGRTDRGEDRTTSSDSRSGTRYQEVMPADEIQCILQDVGVKQEVAHRTAESLTQALRMMNFPPEKFTRTSLLHFLTQIKAESDACGNLTQDGAKSKEKTGYGCIQVTGSYNLKAAEKCINERHPGLGKGVSSDPEHTIGEGTENYVLPVMASLCWWEANMIENDDHNDITRAVGSSAVQNITHIVMTGRLDPKRLSKKNRKAVAASVEKREKISEEIKEGERKCRQLAA